MDADSQSEATVMPTSRDDPPEQPPAPCSRDAALSSEGGWIGLRSIVFNNIPELQVLPHICETNDERINHGTFSDPF